MPLTLAIRFMVLVIAVSGASTPRAAHAQTADTSVERPCWGTLDATGSGFLIGRTDFGEMTLGGYAVIRTINQLPATQTFVDHLRNVNQIDPRNDIQFHRASCISASGCSTRRFVTCAFSFF